jgi:hypothetical protein
MSVHSFAVSVAKPLRVNMIASDMRVFIQAKRSLYAAVNLRLATTGAAAGASLVQMSLDTTFVLRQVACVSDPYSRRRRNQVAGIRNSNQYLLLY